MWCENPAEFYTEEFVKARKPHRCIETHREIRPGEMYWRIRGKWDGTVSTFAQSEAAYHFARGLNGYQRDGKQKRGTDFACIDFGGVGEFVLEFGSDDPERQEWGHVCRGFVTRWTLPGPEPAYVRPVSSLWDDDGA